MALFGQNLGLPRALTAPGLHWLILSQILVFLPHSAHLPIWLMGLSIALTGWRWLALHGYRSLPGTWARWIIVWITVVAYFVQYRWQFSVESAVAFLAMTYSLKILEVRTQRDIYVFVYLSCFLLATQFLFDQSLWWTIYVFLAFMVCMTSLTVVNQIPERRAYWSSLRLVSLIFLQAVPLLLIAYLLFPRIAPLWTVPLKSDKAWTGISDSVRPGDIAELAQSGERAFRVRFKGPAPEISELYWRGVILDKVENDRWSASSFESWRDLPEAPRSQVSLVASAVSYEIIQEPTGRRWGFALAGSAKVSGDFDVNAEGLVRFRRDLLQPTKYQLQRIPPNSEESLTAFARQRYLALPKTGNPRTRAWAEQMQQAWPAVPERVAAMMRYFREQPFYYSLKPDPMRGDQIDAFLFSSRKGFCAHYASALAFALRASGIPARMLIGYQGGEWNPDGGYLMVHQYDAHAWVEVWLEGQGWLRFDPTAMVAPDRVSRGLREAMGEEGDFLENDLLSLNRYANLGVVQWLRLRLDEMNYQWQRWVVQYDEESQLDLFKRWYRDVELRTLGLWLVVIFVGAMLTLMIWLLRQERQRETDPVKRLAKRFMHRLSRYGVARHAGETLNGYVERVVVARPDKAPQLRRVLVLLETALYRSPSKMRANAQSPDRSGLAKVKARPKPTAAQARQLALIRRELRSL